MFEKYLRQIVTAVGAPALVDKLTLLERYNLNLVPASNCGFSYVVIMNNDTRYVARLLILILPSDIDTIGIVIISCALSI